MLNPDSRFNVFHTAAPPGGLLPCGTLIGSYRNRGDVPMNNNEMRYRRVGSLAVVNLTPVYYTPQCRDVAFDCELLRA